jgi:RNA polymerase sigma factor (sigma-70 family)
MWYSPRFDVDPTHHHNHRIVDDSSLSSKRLINGLIEGDEIAYQEFWHQYGARLQRVASRHLPNALARRTEPEDVVQSVCRSFFRRAQGGEFQLSDSEQLWRLLCAITLTKVQKQTRFHFRQKRGVNKEQYFAQSESNEKGVPEPVGSSETPSQAMAFAEQFQALMETLDEEEQIVVQFKLDERSEQDTADYLKCSTRTVRRILKRVRTQLRDAFEE